MKKFLSKAFLCFSLLLLNNVAYAQSDDSQNVVLEKVEGNKYINKDALPGRDLDIYYVLPTVLYNATNNEMTITSPYLTFESVAYYIVDELGFVQQQGELTLRKGDEVELFLPQLSVGSYKIVLEISEEYFGGEFYVE